MSQTKEHLTGLQVLLFIGGALIWGVVSIEIMSFPLSVLVFAGGSLIWAGLCFFTRWFT